MNKHCRDPSPKQTKKRSKKQMDLTHSSRWVSFLSQSSNREARKKEVVFLAKVLSLNGTTVTKDKFMSFFDPTERTKLWQLLWARGKGQGEQVQGTLEVAKASNQTQHKTIK